MTTSSEKKREYKLVLQRLDLADIGNNNKHNDKNQTATLQKSELQQIKVPSYVGVKHDNDEQYNNKSQKHKDKNKKKKKKPSLIDRIFGSAYIMSEMKEQVDDGVTDFDIVVNNLGVIYDDTLLQYKTHFNNCYQNKSQQNMLKNIKKQKGHNKTEIKNDQQLANDEQLARVIYESQLETLSNINTVQQIKLSNNITVRNNLRATGISDWCNEVPEKKHYKNRCAALSQSEIKFKKKMRKKVINTTPQLLRHQSSADRISPNLINIKKQKTKIKEKIKHGWSKLQKKFSYDKTQNNKNQKNEMPNQQNIEVNNFKSFNDAEILKTSENIENERNNFSSSNNNTFLYDSNNISNDNDLYSSNNISLTIQQSVTSPLSFDHQQQKVITEEFPFCFDTMDINELKHYCEPFQRVALVLEAYLELLTTQNEVKIFDIVHQPGKYEHQQLHDDFMHIKIYHIDTDNHRINSHHKDEEKYIDIGKKICQYFTQDLRLKCNRIAKCRAFSRHYQRFVEKSDADWCTEDITFRTECDKIHIFFLHSTVKYGIKYNRISSNAEEEIYKQNRYIQGRTSSQEHVYTFSEDDSVNKIQDAKLKTGKKYIGKKEDDNWWDHINPNDEKQDDEQIYRQLIEKMGVFRWQNPHGFE
eukprot:33788_1